MKFDTENLIKANSVFAQKVVFLQPIFEDDFVEKGMVAWLTDVQWHFGNACYELFFDFTEFEEYNKKYFKKVFHQYVSSCRGRPGPSSRELVTAHEAGCYQPKYSVYFGITGDKQDNKIFEKEICNYLQLLVND
jgi:hypothetical protein